MAKFEVLKKSQIFLNFVGIYLDDSSKPTHGFLAFLAGYYIFISQFIGLIASAAFILKYPTDIKACLGALKVCVAVTQCAGMFMGIKNNTMKTKALQDEFQDIVNEVLDRNGGNGEEHRIYWECEQKCRNNTRRLIYFWIFHTSLFPTVLIYALVCIATGDYDTSKWPLAIHVAVPFDQTSVLGWFLTWLIQLFIAFSYALATTTITLLFVSCCYYIYGMSDHFNVAMNSVGRAVDRLRTEVKPSKINELRQQINTQLCNAIKIQVKIYELFHMMADANSVSIFSLLPVNPIFMSLCMYEIEVYFKDLEPSSLLFDVSCMLCALFWPIFLCHFATHTTDRVSSIGDVVYSSNWFEYPAELQKYTILTISRSQQPIYFTGLGLVNCTLEVFGKHFRTASSYYIMFRTLERR